MFYCYIQPTNAMSFLFPSKYCTLISNCEDSAKYHKTVYKYSIDLFNKNNIHLIWRRRIKGNVKLVRVTQVHTLTRTSSC